MVGAPVSTEIWSPALQSTIISVRKLLPESFTSNVSSEFYVTFWQLSLYDIYIPVTCYTTEIKKNQTTATQLLSKSKTENSSTASKLKDESERKSYFAEQLEREQFYQEENNKRVTLRLSIEKDHWFNSVASNAVLIKLVCEHCIFPRALFTAQDAIFSSRFVMYLHTINAKYWRTLTCFDTVSL